MQGGVPPCRLVPRDPPGKPATESEIFAEKRAARYRRMMYCRVQGVESAFFSAEFTASCHSLHRTRCSVTSSIWRLGNVTQLAILPLNSSATTAGIQGFSYGPPIWTQICTKYIPYTIKQVARTCSTAPAKERGTPKRALQKEALKDHT